MDRCYVQLIVSDIPVVMVALLMNSVFALPKVIWLCWRWSCHFSNRVYQCFRIFMARFASLIVVVLYNFFLSFLSVFFWIVSTCPSHCHRLRWLATLLPAFHVCKASAQFRWCDWCSTNTISFHHSMFDILPIPWSILQVFPSHIQWCLRNESLVVLNVIQTCGLLNFDPTQRSSFMLWSQLLCFSPCSSVDRYYLKTD